MQSPSSVSSYTKSIGKRLSKILAVTASYWESDAQFGFSDYIYSQHLDQVVQDSELDSDTEKQQSSDLNVEIWRWAI